MTPFDDASADPRIYGGTPAPAALARLYALAQASLAAATGRDADAADAQASAALDGLLRQRDGQALARAFAGAPSGDVYRHLWRLLAQRERDGAPDPSSLLRLFALPVIVVAGSDDAKAPEVTLPCVLDEAGALTTLLREHGALAGNQALALSNTLVGADALELARLPDLLAWRALAGEQGPRALPPAPIIVVAGGEAVHLRFLVGTALAGPDADLFRDASVGRWGMPFAQSLSRMLAAPGVSVLALPRAPHPLVSALWQGRLAQREVGAQIFASNAIRKLRAGTGEPGAVISVHRTDSPSGGGEVRLSLSSPFDPRQAEGFRASLLPLDRVEDVVQMFATLLADCRVTDVRRQPGVHPDRDPATGMTLLFKTESAPSAVH
jgi:hypothetical protein